MTHLQSNQTLHNNFGLYNDTHLTNAGWLQTAFSYIVQSNGGKEKTNVNLPTSSKFLFCSLWFFL